METTDLGRAPSPLCGLEDSMREMVFCCGIEGSEAEHADALEEMVLAVLERVAVEGVSQQRLEAVLHQLELHQREVTGDGYPFGLQLILQALGCATHYSDPIAVLNLEPVIVELQQKIQDPDYIRQLARRRVVLVGVRGLGGVLLVGHGPNWCARRLLFTRAESWRRCVCCCDSHAQRQGGRRVCC